MLKRVLVLDNDPGILEVMEEALQYAGFSVDVFEETDDIVALVKQYNPDVLIVDYRLRGVNGAKHCKKIKSNLATAHLPIIVFSAYPQILQSLNYNNFDAFIAKPFDLYEMIDTIKKLIEANSESILIHV